MQTANRYSPKVGGFAFLSSQCTCATIEKLISVRRRVATGGHLTETAALKPGRLAFTYHGYGFARAFGAW